MLLSLSRQRVALINKGVGRHILIFPALHEVADLMSTGERLATLAVGFRKQDRRVSTSLLHQCTRDAGGEPCLQNLNADGLGDPDGIHGVRPTFAPRQPELPPNPDGFGSGVNRYLSAHRFPSPWAQSSGNLPRPTPRRSVL